MMPPFRQLAADSCLYFHAISHFINRLQIIATFTPHYAIFSRQLRLATPLITFAVTLPIATPCAELRHYAITPIF